MKVLVGCESSGTVRRAFRDLGYDAWSCDLLPAEDCSPYHFQEDVLSVVKQGHWDLAIFFPPCTHLAVSGARYFAQKRADGRQQAAIEFFLALASAPITHIAIENPVGIMSTEFHHPEQYIQPWMFGHPESKKTCLWLQALPYLEPTNNVYDEMIKLPKNVRERVHYMTPGPDRWKERSRTLKGVAAAMAKQWSFFVENYGKQDYQMELPL